MGVLDSININCMRLCIRLQRIVLVTLNIYKHVEMGEVMALGRLNQCLLGDLAINPKCVQLYTIYRLVHCLFSTICLGVTATCSYCQHYHFCIEILLYNKELGQYITVQYRLNGIRFRILIAVKKQYRNFVQNGTFWYCYDAVYRHYDNITFYIDNSTGILLGYTCMCSNGNANGRTVQIKIMGHCNR